MPVYEEKQKIDGQKRYYIRTYITDENGNKKQITRHNKDWIGRDGKKEAEFEESKLRKNVIRSDKKKITFKQLCDQYLEEQKQINKESTYYTYFKLIKKWIEPYFDGNKEVDTFCLNDIINWRNIIISSKISLRMKNKCHNVLSSIFNIGIKFEYLEKNFEQSLGSFKEKNEETGKIKNNIRYITFEQFQKFISVVDNNDWYVFFTFLYYTGMRKGEVQALSWKNVDFTTRKIKVKDNLTPKTFEGPYKITNTKNKENRNVDMDDHLFKVLKDYYNIKSANNNFSINDFVFGGKQPFSRATIDRKKKLYFDRANIKEITIHEFRHSHVSLVINEAVKKNLDMLGVFIMLSERMGHTIEVMQKIYLHLFPNIQNEIINILNNLQKQDQKQDQK